MNSGDFNERGFFETLTRLMGHPPGKHGRNKPTSTRAHESCLLCVRSKLNENWVRLGTVKQKQPDKPTRRRSNNGERDSSNGAWREDV